MSTLVLEVVQLVGFLVAYKFHSLPHSLTYNMYSAIEGRVLLPSSKYSIVSLYVHDALFLMHFLSLSFLSGGGFPVRVLFSPSAHFVELVTFNKSH